MNPEEFSGVFHRAHIEEWSNYDSVKEEMVSTHYSYVEALRFSPNGRVVAMVKIGAYSPAPQLNGALELNPANPETYNFLGEWTVQNGVLEASLRPASEKVSLVAKWVGIFYLPGGITLRDGQLADGHLKATVTYDNHPIWEDGSTTATYEQLVTA